MIVRTRGHVVIWSPTRRSWRDHPAWWVVAALLAVAITALTVVMLSTYEERGAHGMDFRQTLTALQPPDAAGMEAERRTPAYGLQAVATASGFTLSAGVLAGLAGLLFCWGTEADAKLALAFAGVVMFLAGLWFYWMADRMVWIEETVRRVDLNRDGYIGPPPPVVNQVHYTLETRPGHHIRGMLPVSDELLKEWCEAASQGQSLSITYWTPRFALPDGTHGREEYETFRQAAIRQGLAKDVGGSVGLRLTGDGWKFVSELLGAEPVPLLEQAAAYVE